MKHLFEVAAVAALLCLPFKSEAQKFENLGKTPAMGWNSWNKFACDINEDLIKGTIDAMSTNGLRDAGYVYVNLDDCWHGERDSLGFIQADPVKFKSGIKALSDYAHSKDMKLGIYTCCGTKTCAGRPGSLGHEYQDALQYAKWGIDYLKEDWCFTDNVNAKGAYTLMRDALHAAGRPIYFSMCEWGSNKPWEWAKNVGNSWRTTGDIQNNFKSVLNIIDLQKNIRQYAGPGHWNDPDMLEVGNGMSENEDRAHFSMWCMLAAPLILGNDVCHMSKATADIIMNKEVIALDQDTLGVEGKFVGSEGNLEFWFKPLANGDWAFCILNRGTDAAKYTIDWKKLDLNDDLSKRSTDFDKVVYAVRNLWTKKNEGTTKKDKKVVVPGHDVLVYRLIAKK